MIEFATSARTLGGTRLGASALWDLVASLYLLGAGRVAWPYDAWAERARAVLGRPECAPLLLLAGRPDEFPDFLLPAPGPGELADDLDNLRTVRPEQVRDELGRRFPHGVPDGLRPYVRDPAGAMAALADAYAAYWRAAIAPVAPVMREVLDTEVLVRGRSLALAGLDGLLGTLHRQIRWDDDRLALLRPSAIRVDARERTLRLVPLVFGGDRLMAGWDAHTVTVAYPARGAVRLADRGDRRDGAALALLLGTGRATVLAALRHPVTTRALARQLGLAPSTISEHLSLLTRAGVVDRLAGGRRVYYQANAVGRALLESLG